MMVITHMLVGGVLATIAGPEYIIAGLIGGIFPDLDLGLWQHRKDLHYPYLYGAAALSAVISYAIAGSALWLYIAVFLGAAWIHSISDILGGGLEARPWKKTDDRGVYSHIHNRWLTSRHVFYDGSPGDFVLSLSAAAVLFVSGFNPKFLALTVAAAGLYTAVRKKIPDYFTMKPEIEIKHDIEYYVPWMKNPE